MQKKDKLNYMGATVSIFANIGLFILKYWAGIVSSSVALLADAWHTLSDSLSSIILMCSVKLSSRKPDKEHPFGHGRWEQIACIFIGVLLAIIAYEFLTEAIIKLQKRESATFGRIAVIVTIISIFAKEAMAQLSFYIFRKTGNSAMKADGWHHRSDALTSLAILMGIFLQKYLWWIDSVMAIIVSLVLFYVVFQIINEATNKILGEEITDEDILKIKNIIRERFGTDLNANHFKLHNYGRHKELTFHIEVSPEMNIEKAHSIATEIENNIFEKLDLNTTIHIEPRKKS